MRITITTLILAAIVVVGCNKPKPDTDQPVPKCPKIDKVTLYIATKPEDLRHPYLSIHRETDKYGCPTADTQYVRIVEVRPSVFIIGK